MGILGSPITRSQGVDEKTGQAGTEKRQRAEGTGVLGKCKQRGVGNFGLREV